MLEKKGRWARLMETHRPVLLGNIASGKPAGSDDEMAKHAEEIADTNGAGR